MKTEEILNAFEAIHRAAQIYIEAYDPYYNSHGNYSLNWEKTHFSFTATPMTSGAGFAARFPVSLVGDEAGLVAQARLDKAEEDEKWAARNAGLAELEACEVYQRNKHWLQNYQGYTMFPWP